MSANWRETLHVLGFVQRPTEMQERLHDISEKTVNYFALLAVTRLVRMPTPSGLRGGQTYIADSGPVVEFGPSLVGWNGIEGMPRHGSKVVRSASSRFATSVENVRPTIGSNFSAAGPSSTMSSCWEYVTTPASHNAGR